MPEAINSLSFVEFGHQASKDFLENGVPMDSTIAKIAEENDLLPHQIQRVCEQANHRTYSELFKAAKDKTFKFDLADPEKIIAALESDSTEKTSSDYLSSPKSSVAIEVNKIFGVAEISNEPEVDEKIKQAAAGIESIAEAKRELESRLVDVDVKIEAAVEDLYKVAKEMVIDKMELGEIWKCARQAPNGESFARDFARMSIRMGHEGLLGAATQYFLKTAEAVDEELVSKRLQEIAKPTGIEVVNGRHPIMISLNTLADYRSQRDRLARAVQNLNGSMLAVRDRIEQLKGSKKIDKFVLDEQQKV